ncbi:homoserine dehydrogenase [Rufibacter latericius]|uniref:Homoserine dehydrogenase n=1 Tax=Rufibacter latericius TaxID=2487040 RepID=A0A3M9MUZ6_9BACT|nr:homoserine dehydrogenase [Rufibacter latericius]RNI29015.1 homoserine dehydrogenase [Rufibacter latericius]
MDSHRLLKIGLFGFGCVGQGLYDILSREESLPYKVERICVKDPKKLRPLPTESFTYDWHQVLQDDSLDILVEAISDANEAYTIVAEALRRGKKVVTANKKLVAYHLPELLNLQREFGGALLYEAAVAGGIPIIRTVEEYFSNEPLERVHGILNGSSNYILSQIFKLQKGYAEALKEAQDKGFAELDPWLDVAGADSRHKLCILSAHAFGRTIAPEEVAFFGIDYLNGQDCDYAKQNNSVIKMVASVHLTADGELVPVVLPSLVDNSDDLFVVEQEFNGVVVQGTYSGAQLFKGRGAGGHPTGAAVLSDIVSISNGYSYGYKKLHKTTNAPALALDFEFDVYLRSTEPELVVELGLTNLQNVQRENESFSVTGTVSLGNLIKSQEHIRKAGAYIMALSSDFVGAPVKRSKVKEEVS